MDTSTESGPEFEARGLDLARSIHDPTGTQGSVMHGGRERDGVFINADAIHAYEFTIARTKDKASKDGEKLATLVKQLGQRSGNIFKSRTGWFVTREEPTADQRTAIEGISEKFGERVHAISISTLHHRICNSEQYLNARKNAPFGSVSIEDASAKQLSVPVRLLSAGNVNFSLKDIDDATRDGQRALVIGDYGVGKSHTLRELHREKQRSHFRSSKLTPFPVHINLRDCAGLKTPAEILRRHAGEIGFDDPDGLISAWRAGACCLLLDGFDEIVPARWFGSVADLKSVRWEALSPVRRLVQETPRSSGIVVAGRSHYFSSPAEMTEALGFKNYEIYRIPDFNEEQLAIYLKQAGVHWTIPEWVPMRPLLLGYLVASGSETASDITASVDRATGWNRFIGSICEREASMFSAVRPETIRRLISRVATLARSRTDVTGPFDMDLLRSAFVDVNGLQPDEEGMQLLLRLPGLAQDPGGKADSRVFVDRDLAETAYGLDLADFALNPYDDVHPMSSVASWANAAGDLGIEIAALSLTTKGAGRAIALAALSARTNSDHFDAVTADLLRLVVSVSEGKEATKHSYHISGVYFEDMTLVDSTLLAAAQFHECVFGRLDIEMIDEHSQVPHFDSCLIDFLDGAAVTPGWLEKRMSGCEIARYSDAAMTTSGIMHLSNDRDSRIALSILKKVYGQRGSGRKEGALSRGLQLADREEVPRIIAEMTSQGWIARTGTGSNVVYIGVKSRRPAALQALAAPSEFKL